MRKSLTKGITCSMLAATESHINDVTCLVFIGGDYLIRLIHYHQGHNLIRLIHYHQGHYLILQHGGSNRYHFVFLCDSHTFSECQIKRNKVQGILYSSRSQLSALHDSFLHLVQQESVSEHLKNIYLFLS
jgi:hypothetical protein